MSSLTFTPSNAGAYDTMNYFLFAGTGSDHMWWTNYIGNQSVTSNANWNLPYPQFYTKTGIWAYAVKNLPAPQAQFGFSEISRNGLPESPLLVWEPGPVSISQAAQAADPVMIFLNSLGRNFDTGFGNLINQNNDYWVWYCPGVLDSVPKTLNFPAVYPAGISPDFYSTTGLTYTANVYAVSHTTPPDPQKLSTFQADTNQYSFWSGEYMW
jgi:hypothetical protein